MLKLRDQKLQELANLVEPVYGSRYIKTGEMLAYNVPLLHSTSLCQVFEVKSGDKDLNMDNHTHLESREIFYQLKGETVFGDGTVLTAGDIKIIEPNVAHSVTLKKNSLYIVIVHPIEKAYKV